MSKFIYHLTTKPEWKRAMSSGIYRPRGFDEEGFIHCSHEHQLTEVTNRLFYAEPELITLCVDLSKLSVPVVEENLEGGTELYPHLYGELPVEAVAQVIPREEDADGQ